MKKSATVSDNSYLQKLINAFEKEADCNVDDVVSPSNRISAGITSNDVMRIAAEPTMRAKRVVLDADGSPSDLIALLTELGAKRKGERNPNLNFLLPNGGRFLKGDESIPGVELEPQSYAVKITFPDAVPAASDKKKPDAKKTGGEKKSGTTEKKRTASGTLTGDATASTGGTAAIAPPRLDANLMG